MRGAEDVHCEENVDIAWALSAQEETLSDFLRAAGVPDTDVPFALAALTSTDAGLSSSSMLTIPQSSFEGFMTLFARTALARQPALLPSLESDTLDELTLPDESQGERGLGGLLSAMLVSSESSAADSWRQAMRKVAFDNFFDNPDDEESHDSVKSGVVHALARGTTGLHSDRTAEQQGQKRIDGDEDDEVPELPTSMPAASQVPEVSSALFSGLRGLAAECDNTVDVFTMDSEFDYEAHVVGTSRRV